MFIPDTGKCEKVISSEEVKMLKIRSQSEAVPEAGLLPDTSCSYKVLYPDPSVFNTNLLKCKSI